MAIIKRNQLTVAKTVQLTTALAARRGAILENKPTLKRLTRQMAGELGFRITECNIASVLRAMGMDYWTPPEPAPEPPPAEPVPAAEPLPAGAADMLARLSPVVRERILALLADDARPLGEKSREELRLMIHKDRERLDALDRLVRRAGEDALNAGKAAVSYRNDLSAANAEVKRLAQTVDGLQQTVHQHRQRVPELDRAAAELERQRGMLSRRIDDLVTARGKDLAAWARLERWAAENGYKAPPTS